MKLSVVFAGVLMVAVPFFCEAQAKVKKKNGVAKKVKITQASGETKIEREDDGTTTVTMESVDGHEAKIKLMPPSWALSQGYMNDRHVYFPDYYLFYTPARGYVYWNDGKWESNRTLPDYLKHVDLRKARAQILDNDDGNGFPERDFKSLSKQYPAEPAGISLQTPEQ